jgi:hypothetical protein
VEGPVPDFCAPFEAQYDRVFMENFKLHAQAPIQMAFAQERFGFPGITAADRDKGDAAKVAVVVTPTRGAEVSKAAAEEEEAPADADAAVGELGAASNQVAPQ